MVEAQAPRRRAAILAADVIGYSRLMQRDEAGTPAAPKEQRSGEGNDAPPSLLDFRPKSHGHVQRAFREDQYLKT